MGVQIGFSQTGKMLSYRMDSLLLKAFYHFNSQRGHQIRIGSEGAAGQVTLRVPRWNIQHRGHVHIEPHKTHLGRGNGGKPVRFLQRIGGLTDCRGPLMHGKRLLQPGHPAPFLIHGQKKRSTGGGKRRLLQAAAQAGNLDGLPDVSRKKDHASHLVGSDQFHGGFVGLGGRDSHHEKGPYHRV